MRGRDPKEEKRGYQEDQPFGKKNTQMVMVLRLLLGSAVENQTPFIPMTSPPPSTQRRRENKTDREYLRDNIPDSPIRQCADDCLQKQAKSGKPNCPIPCGTFVVPDQVHNDHCT